MTMTEDLLVVVATPLTISACCPLCGSTSDQTHSRYRRTVADLPLHKSKTAAETRQENDRRKNVGALADRKWDNLSTFTR